MLDRIARLTVHLALAAIQIELVARALSLAVAMTNGG